MHPTGSPRRAGWARGISAPDRQPARIDGRRASSDLRRWCCSTPIPASSSWIAHGGGFLPAYSGRIDHGAAAARPTPASICTTSSRTSKRLYFDTMVFTHHQLEYLVEVWGADHILMGTDYPLDMGEVDPIGLVVMAPASSATATARRSSAVPRGSSTPARASPRMSVSLAQPDDRRHRIRHGRELKLHR